MFNRLSALLAVVTAVLVVVTTAAPSELERRGNVCPDVLYSVPQCCAPNVLNVGSLDCKTPSQAGSIESFKSACLGGQPMCCTVPAAGQGNLCQTPVGA